MSNFINSNFVKSPTLLDGHPDPMAAAMAAAIQELSSEMCSGATNEEMCAANFASLPEKLPAMMETYEISDSNVVLDALKQCAPGLMGDSSVMDKKPLGEGNPTCREFLTQLFG
jgi:hypothetical protein